MSDRPTTEQPTRPRAEAPLHGGEYACFEREANTYMDALEHRNRELEAGSKRLSELYHFYADELQKLSYTPPALTMRQELAECYKAKAQLILRLGRSSHKREVAENHISELETAVRRWWKEARHRRHIVRGMESALRESGKLANEDEKRITELEAGGDNDS